jgi:hypothetical protein
MTIKYFVNTGKNIGVLKLILINYDIFGYSV